MSIYVCQNTECGVHTFTGQDTHPSCPGCDEETIHGLLYCPECTGTGLRVTAGRSMTIICTGCSYHLDVADEAPAFLGYIESTTEQATLERFGAPPERPVTRWGAAFNSSPPAGTLGWCLDATRDSVLYCTPRTLSRVSDELAPEYTYDDFLWERLTSEFVDEDGQIEAAAAAGRTSEAGNA